MDPASPAILLPARRAATRLPDKLLLATTGKAVVVHACERAAEAFGPQQVIVCVDDDELAAVVEAAGFTAMRTRPDHQSGTDRIAEVAAGLSNELIINVQADEPEMDPEHIRTVAGLLTQHADCGMATLAVPAQPGEDLDPNAVKVVLGHTGKALYFTRAPCPWDRDAGGAGKCLRHLGIYAYRRDILLGYHALPASALEASEKLEQLRALEAGIGIAVAVVDAAPPGVDVQADYDAFVTRWRTQQGVY